VEFFVRRPSPPNTYSYVREENLGSTRNSVEIYLLFMCITNPVLERFLQPMHSKCIIPASLRCFENMTDVVLPQRKAYIRTEELKHSPQKT
jgi:hypothetical protein